MLRSHLKTSKREMRKSASSLKALDHCVRRGASDDVVDLARKPTPRDCDGMSEFGRPAQPRAAEIRVAVNIDIGSGTASKPDRVAL